MRGRRWLGAAIVALLVAGTPAVALGVGSWHGSSAATSKVTSTPRQGEWRGRTDQHSRIVFDVLRTRKGLTVRPYDVEVVATCDNGDQIFAGFGGGSRLIGSDGSFRFHFYDPFFGSFTFEGRLGAESGTGTARIDFGALTRNLQAQLCTSGDVPWAASAPGAAASAAGTAAPHAQYHVQITESRTGQVSWTVTKG